MSSQSMKYYTISTRIFTDIETLRKQMKEWADKGLIKPGTKILEIKKEIPWDLETAIEVILRS